ncbi:MAG: protein kinase domain-containing protein [Burkholderiaceae bacterium]
MSSLDKLCAGWAAISTLLDEALALPAGERAAWLDALAGERAAHRETLLALLRTQAGVERDDAFLRDLPCLPPPDAGAGVGPGSHVGPWRIVREIARGGMGTVWLAERADGVMERRVALKLPRVAWDDAFAARLARERRILAGLEHAHIARLYDAGVDAQGRPWLAMEFVEGEPIDAWCSARAPALRARVELLLQVADAMAHAHARLVVHRDLKPGNVLVTPEGEVRVLDFGIAKLIDEDAATATAMTAHAGRAYTLAYASPEQVRGDPPGTASDLYSLGVLACELLAGARPYRVRRGSAAELEEQILAGEPPRASEVATDPATARALRGDLDAILARTLRKSPSQRYPTMDAFARDLRRWRDGEPVEARPEGWRYRAAKFVRRHRLPVAAGAVAALALAAGTSVALWQAREARLQAQRALAEAATARAAQDFLEDVFRQSGGDDADPDRARSTTARELLDRGAERIDGALRDAPAARLRLLGTLADMYGNMALLDKAAALQRRRVALARASFGPDTRELAEAEAALGHALAMTDLRREASAAADDAARILDRLHEGPSRARWELEYARALVGQRDDYDRGLAAAGQAIAIARAIGAPRELVQALETRSEIAASQHDYALAHDGATEAIAIAGRDSSHGGNELSALWLVLADAQAGLGDLDAADTSYRRAIEVSNQRNRVAPIYLYTAQSHYGSFLRRFGRLREAVDVLRPGYDWARATPAGYGTVTPSLVGEYGRTLVAYGRPGTGLAVLEEALALQARVGGEAPETVAGLRVFRAQALADLDRLAEAQADARAAHAWFDDERHGGPAMLAPLDRMLDLRTGRAAQALAQWRATRTAQHKPVVPAAAEPAKLQAEAARLYLDAGDPATAATLARNALARSEAGPKPAWQAELQASAARVLGEALLAQGELADARGALERSLALARTIYDPDRSPVIAQTLAVVAEARRRTGDAAGAGAALAEARRMRGTAPAAGGKVVASR